MCAPLIAAPAKSETFPVNDVSPVRALALGGEPIGVAAGNAVGGKSAGTAGGDTGGDAAGAAGDAAGTADGDEVGTACGVDSGMPTSSACAVPTVVERTAIAMHVATHSARETRRLNDDAKSCNTGERLAAGISARLVPI
jgi:hypothetical protein